MILNIWDEEQEKYVEVPAIKGSDGKNFTILGFYGTLSALQAAVQTPAAGDAYGIGAEAPYDIYIFDGVTNAWEAVDMPNSLPSVTASDNGKFLRVVNGAWTAVEIANANGGSF